MADGVTVLEPLVASDPDQLPDAEQDVALTLDQVSVSDCPSVIVAFEAEMLTVGFGVGDGLMFPPPLPQALSRVTSTARMTPLFPHAHLSSIASLPHTY